MFKEFEENGFKYYVKNEEAYIISTLKAKETKLIVPDTLGGYPVVEVLFYMASLYGYDSIRLSKNIKFFDGTSFGETIECIEIDDDNDTFAVKDGILYSKDFRKLVCFPPAKKDFDISFLDDVEVICDGAFCCCDSIKSVKIPDSVRKIGDFAFARSETLESIEIPDSVVDIGKAIFAYCDKLKQVILSNNIKSLSANYSLDAEGEGFLQGTAIQSIVIPDSVHKIGHFAFYDCNKLNEIYIPKSVNSIVDTAFIGCDNLTRIVVSEENKNFYVTDIGLYDKNNNLIFKFKK